jgi:hypothetical protein
MSRRHAHPDPFRGAPIFVASRRRHGWTRLSPALVVVGVVLAVGLLVAVLAVL